MDNNTHRFVLQQIAHRVMLERGLEPDFTEEVLSELKKINAPATYSHDLARDMRNLPWCSVDNADSLDLDQLTCAEQLQENIVRLFIAIADVDSLVNAQSAIDQHASINTTSVYTIAELFPMLPEKLSTDLTSLHLDADRSAVVIEMDIAENGSLLKSNVYRAIVRNHAKLVYESLAAWLEGNGPIPQEVTRENGLAENIKLQDQIAQKMKELRSNHGTLEFENAETSPVFIGDALSEMKVEPKNRAKSLIENFMIAANGTTARYLSEKNFTSIRRVVRTPKSWERIVELASEHRFSLPVKADSKSLSEFLKFIQQSDPVHYPDVSLSVLKLLGSGEYIVETPGSESPIHFGLAVKDYSHSTAPNRRYPDLVIQRLLKAALAGNPVPYSIEQLEAIARNCTLKEDVARKVERQVEKSANAILMESRIGEVFEAIVTGAATKGTWIRLLHPHVEGKLVDGFHGLKVGDKLRARLTQINVEEGFIDFIRER